MDRKHPVIIHADEQTSTDRGGGVVTTHLVTRETGSSRFLNGVTKFGPGGSIPLHWHNCEESVLILEGEAIFEAAGAMHELAAGDVTWTPARVPHRFANRGLGMMLIFWTYGSVRATRTIAATGETFIIGSSRESPIRR